MRRAAALIVIMLVIVSVAYFTKPTQERCMQEAIVQYQQVLDNITPAVPDNINKDVFKATMEKSFEESLDVEDKIVYQAIYEQKGTTKKMIGWGAFGKVSVDVK